ncbi:hypothetical protein PRZ48_005290 [Zasmidium cellare]|uniref:Uncharacterized protein n=1 Tax=Zasmidium cellare TaxID=395010 RepID=A0ABR0ESL6_ZASCE|nr:hypothetical protein PRZ48_005290 [Zasmidium cellare]
MGVGWDAAMDQKLLIVALHVKSVDAKDICGGWSSVFPSDTSPVPTYWSVCKRLMRLRKSTAASEKGGKIHKAKGRKPGAKKAAKQKRKSHDEESSATETESEYREDL